MRSAFISRTRSSSIIFPNRPTSSQTATKDQGIIIETVIISEKRETDSDRTGQLFKKVQISKVYQYIEDKVVEVAIDFRTYMDI